MSAAVESVRSEWEDGHRRLSEQSRDARRYSRLLRQVEAVTEELSRRVGQTFTIAELAREYREADRWGREAVVERAPETGEPFELALVTASAFHLYARGATDYAP